MIDSNVARRYARAVFELGLEQNSLDALSRELGALADAYTESAELRAAFANPLVALDAKRGIVGTLADRVGASPTTKNLARMLCDRRRMPALPRIAQLVREMADARKGVVHAEVVTAVALAESFYERLKSQLERMSGQKVVLTRRVDPSLVGGVTTRIGDRIIDGSLRASLDEMKNSLLSAEVTKKNGAGAPIASA